MRSVLIVSRLLHLEGSKSSKMCPYERKAMAKSVPRIPATEETPMATALLEVGVEPAADEDLVPEPEEPELPEEPVEVALDAPVGEGRLV